jgi:hypothetical protein
VIEVYAFVSAASCEDDLLGLLWDRGRRRGERKTPNSGCVGIEEEGVCELGIFVRAYCYRNAVKDSVVGSRDYLDRGGGFRGRWVS